MKRSLRLLLLLLTISTYSYAQYCVTGGPSSTFDSDIEDVVLIGDNFAINNLATCPGVVGIDDYTATDSADVSLGTSYSLNVTFGTCGGNYDGVGEAWIDWNQNGTFETSESVGAISAPASSQPVNANFSFTVPATALLGETRMRVMQWENGTLPLDPCGSFTWGAVEDYKLVVTNTPPSCPNPTLPQLSWVTDTEAEIYWSGTGVLFNIEYGPAGYAQGTGTLTSSTNDTITLSGLLPNSGYDVYIQNDCSGSGNGVSSWLGPLSFTTLCAAFTAPYTENFDALPTGTPVSCWELYGIPGFFQPSALVSDVGNATPVSAPNHLDFNNGFSNNTFWVSPILGGLDSNNYQLEFWIASDGNPLTVVVGSQLSQSDTASFVPIQTITANSTYALQTVYLNSITPGHKHISFKHDPNAFLNSIYIDNLAYTTIPSCVPPLNITFSALSGSVDVGFNFTGGSSVNYEWGPTGFAQGTGTAGATSANPFNISGLSPNTTYDVYLQGDCGANGISPWVGPFTFTTPCVTATLPYLRDFDTWPPACFDMTGGAQQWLHEANDYARGNFWSWQQGIEAFMTTEPIFIDQNAQVEYKWSHQYNTFYPLDAVVVRAQVVGTTVWDTISYLIGPNFDTPNSGPTTPGDFAQEITYLDPATYTGQNVIIQLIASSGFGPDVFLDDFEVNYVPACPEPLQLGATQLQGYQADLFWNGGGPAYNVEYGPQGFGQGSGTVVPALNDTITLTGLVPSTCYDYYVQSDCGGGQISTWNGPYTFCTTVSCPVPTGLNASASSNTATIVYVSGGAPDVNYIIGPTGVTPGTGTVQSSSSTGTIVIPGLTPQTNYDFWMRDSCSAGDVSAWVGPIAIQTLCAPIAAPAFTDWSGITAGSTGFIVANCWNLGDNMNGSFPGSIPRWETETGTGANINSFNTGPWYDNTTFGQAGGNYIYMETSGGLLDDSAYAISPEYDITALTTPELSFYYHMYGGAMGTLRVDIWNNGVWSSGLWSATGEQHPTGDASWTKATVSLAAYTGTVIVRFAGIRGNSFTSDMAIDDIRIDEVPACPEPTFPGAFNIDLNMADVFWTAADPNATSWVIEYGPAGFTPGTGTSMLASNDTSTITGLAAATSYTYYVAEICPNGDTSIYAGPVTFNTPVCALSNQCAYTIDMIDSFGDGWNGNVLGIVQNGVLVATFGQGFLTGSSFGPDSVMLCDGASTQIVVETLGAFTNEVGFTITDPNGMVVYDHIPGNNFTAQTVFASFVANCAAPLCASPTNVNVLSVDTNTADVYFTPGDPNATTWYIEYGPAGFAPGTGTMMAVSNDTATISGLSLGTSYDFYVAELCPNGVDTSFFTGPGNFNTPICAQADKCAYTIDMVDSFGDGWNGNVLAFEQNGIQAGTFGSGFLTGSVFGPDTVYLCPNIPTNIVVETLGSFTNEVGFTVYDASGQMVYDYQPGTPFTATTVFHTFAPSCIPPACPNPSALAANNITANSADLSWTEGTPGASTWYVEYGTSGFTPGTGTMVTATSNNPYNLMNLNAATSYDFYVAELCANGVDSSNFVGPVTFSTACATVSLPYSTDFETLTSGDVGPSLINCWETTGSGSAPNWSAWESTGANSNSFNTGPHYDNTLWGTPGGKYMYLECSGGSLGDTAGLVSVPIDLAGINNPQVDFYYHMYGANMGNLYVAMNAGAGWIYIDTIAGQQQTAGTDTFRLRSVPMTGATGTVRIKFLGERGASFDSDMSIDDVMITNGGSTTPPCPAPTNLAAAGSTCTSVDLDWDGTGNGSLIQYGPAGFTPGTGTMAFGTQPYTISGLSAATAYDFWVADTCGITNDTSAYAGPFTFTTPNQPTPAISFTWNQTSTTSTNADVDFDATGTTGGMMYFWDFGNGSTDSSANPTTTYSQNGVYSVVLRVFNDCGMSDTIFDITVAGISLLEQDLGNSIEVYPNPTVGEFRVVIESDRNRDFQFELLDLQGRVIEQSSMTDLRGRNEVGFDLTDFAQGVYMLRITSEGASTIRRVYRH